MGITLIDKIIPKNNAFTGLVDVEQIIGLSGWLGSGGYGTTPYSGYVENRLDNLDISSGYLSNQIIALNTTSGYLQTDISTHSASGNIHRRIFIQSNEPVALASGDIWIQIL